MTQSEEGRESRRWQSEGPAGRASAMSTADDRGVRSSDWARLRLSAVGVVACLLSLGLLMALAPAAMTPRTLQTPGAEAVIAEGPLWALAFYLGDSLFVLIALAFFLVLARLAQGPRWLVLFGVAAAFGKAGFDLAENLSFGAAAWTAWQSAAVGEISEKTVVVLTTLKRVAGGLAVLAFAPLYRGSDLGARLVRALLWLGAAATAAGFVIPALQEANAMLLFFTTAVVSWHAGVHARR